MAEAYSCRPSELLGVEGSYEAWCLDEVAFTWGMAVDGAVERARQDEEDPKQVGAAAYAMLDRLLSDPKEDTADQEEVPRGRFRDPAPDFAAARALRKRPQ